MSSAWTDDEKIDAFETLQRAAEARHLKRSMEREAERAREWRRPRALPPLETMLADPHFSVDALRACRKELQDRHAHGQGAEDQIAGHHLRDVLWLAEQLIEERGKRS